MAVYRNFVGFVVADVVLVDAERRVEKDIVAIAVVSHLDDGSIAGRNVPVYCRFSQTRFYRK